MEYEFRFKMPDDMRLAEPEVLRIGSDRSLHSMTFSSDILALSHRAKDATTIDVSEIRSPEHLVNMASITSLFTTRNALSGAALSAFVLCGLFIGLRGTPTQEQRALASENPAALALAQSSYKTAEKADATSSTVLQFADRAPRAVLPSPSFVAPVGLSSHTAPAAPQMTLSEPQKWVAGSVSNPLSSQPSGTALVSTAALTREPATGLSMTGTADILAAEPPKKESSSEARVAKPEKSSHESSKHGKTKKSSSKVASITPVEQAASSARVATSASIASAASASSEAPAAPEKGHFLKRKMDVEAAASPTSSATPATPATAVADRQRIF